MNDQDVFVFGPFRLSPGRRELLSHGEPVQLGARAFDLLLALLRRGGHLATKDELMAEVWPDSVVEENNLQVQISTLRKTFGGEPESSRYLLTVAGRGYRFVGEIKRSGTADDGAVSSAQQSGGALSLPDKPSIAVLPFTNMSGDPEQEYFADGMAEEIITALSRCSWLFVIARNSSFTYKSRAIDVRQVGRELGVRYVLEGSVRRSGARLRFTAQLIDATSGAHVWADRFDGDTSDVFDLQDRITENVVAIIEPKLQLAEIERIKHKTAANLNAYEHLLRAQQFEHAFTAESIGEALRHLKLAEEIDPTYAPALALAAYCYGMRGSQGWFQDAVVETAECVRLISRALEFGGSDANVLWMCAAGAWQAGLDPKRPLDLAYRSLENNPNSAMAWTVAGWIEAYTGRYAKGIELLGRAQRLNPRDPHAWFTANGMAMACLGEGRYAEGVIWAHKARAKNPLHIGSMRLLAAHLAHLGRRDEAAGVVAEMLHMRPNLTIAKTRAPRTYMHDDLWEKFSQGLRLAGLPE
jgi:TolB-like protein